MKMSVLIKQLKWRENITTSFTLIHKQFSSPELSMTQFWKFILHVINRACRCVNDEDTEQVRTGFMFCFYFFNFFFQRYNHAILKKKIAFLPWFEQHIYMGYGRFLMQWEWSCMQISINGNFHWLVDNSWASIIRP